MKQNVKLFINGKWLSSSTGDRLKNLNPATGESIGASELGSKEDVKKAVDAAEKAFEPWSSTPAPQRAKILLKAADLMQKRKESLSRLLTREMGKVLPEARGDVQEAIDITLYAAGEGRRLFGETTPSELKDKFCFTIRRPLGVVGMIAPWNFPIAIPCWKAMPALVAGNTAVFKPAEDTPVLASEMVKILHESGLPKGVFNMVTGSGEEAGQALVHSKKVSAISFTGSKETGSLIMSQAAKDVKHVSLELGGKNPLIVMDDAKLDLALDGIIWGGFGTSGQRCTAASRVIVHRKIKAKLLKKLVAATKRLKLGNGLNPKTDVGPVINRAQLERIEHYAEIGKTEAKLLTGGKIVHPKGLKKGFFFEPTIFSDVDENAVIAQEEIFGPVVSVIEAKDFGDAVSKANNSKYGLSSAIYTENLFNAFKAIEKLDTGVGYVNASTIGAEVHLPFGGTKGTGNGFREAGTEAVKEFTEIKACYIDFSGKLQKAQIDAE